MGQPRKCVSLTARRFISLCEFGPNPGADGHSLQATVLSISVDWETSSMA